MAGLRHIAARAGQQFERAGSAAPARTNTLTAYQPGHPSMVRQAADRFSALLRG